MKVIKKTERTDGLPNFTGRYSKLTKKEQFMYNVMFSKTSTLFLQSSPGLAKSSKSRSIAEKMGYQYIDLRLSQLEEVDIGGTPVIKKMDDGTQVQSVAIPEWAYCANQKHTIIHVEELNRAIGPVRNAGLQLFNERGIGYNFKFNENVFLMASGNLGTTDNCDVEEFDAALRNRLVYMPYSLDINEWVDDFAKDHVLPVIIDFIKSRPEHYYKDSNTSSEFATPRSWTALSNYIVSTYGNNASHDEYMQDIIDHGEGFVGPSIVAFINYLKELKHLTIEDVLNNFDKVENELKKFNRDKLLELLNGLEKTKLLDLKIEQIKNLVKFCKHLDKDALMGFASNQIDLIDIENIDIISTNEKYKTFFNPFKEICKMFESKKVT